MYSGKKLGAALAEAIRRKGVSKTAVAKAFGIKAPSVHGWIANGRIGKKHIDFLVEYFSDVVGPEHWGFHVGLPGTGREPRDLLSQTALTAAEAHLIALWRELLLDEQRATVIGILESEAHHSRKVTAEVRRRQWDHAVPDAVVAGHIKPRPAQRELAIERPATGKRTGPRGHGGK